jgi:neutral ceramidase
MIRRIFFVNPVLAGLLVILIGANQTLHAQNKTDVTGAKTSNVFRAGAATSNITPFLGGGIVGNFGIPPEAIFIHDELHCRCLVLDDGTTKLVFVVVDVIGLDRGLIDEARRIINKETNIPGEDIVVSAIHTHSATSAQGVSEDAEFEKRIGWNLNQQFDDYQKLVIRRIADVVRITINNLEPARIGWGVGSVPQHVFVRRWKMKPGTPMPNPFGGQDQVVMNPGFGNPNLLEPDGKPDPEVSFISVQSVKGRPIALLANYSLHYVGGVPRNHISADYFAVFADRIQELLKADRQDPPFVGIMSNGTSGNVNNNNLFGPAEKNPPYAKMKIVADDLAREVLRVNGTIRYHDWVRLQAAMEELTLQVRKPDQQMIARAKMVLSRPDSVKPVHRYEKEYAERTLQMQEYPDKINIILQTFRIGDLGVAAIPFETFAETGMEIKAKSPFKPSFTMELANGCYGYLPTPEEHKLGGYETWLGTNRVEIEASTKIVAKLLDLFAKLK